jgi:hypothetical protein
VLAWCWAVVLGKGWGLGGALLSHVFSKMATNSKATPKPLQRLLQSLKPLIFKGFGVFLWSFGVIEICIEKTGILLAKIVPTGGAGRRAWWGWFWSQLQNSKTLDFQGFSDHLKCLIFNNLSLLQKNLSSA